MGLRFRNRAVVIATLVGAAAACADCGSGAHAQRAPIDPVAYKKAKDAATKTFFNRRATKAQRLAAADKLRYPSAETFKRLLVLGANRRENDAIRLRALQRALYDGKYVDTVLAILANARDGGEVLNAGLVDDLSRRTTFRHPAKLRQRIQAGLRARLADKRQKVRLAAYRSLVASHDTVAINKLVEALRRNRALPIPLADGIELLDVDGSTKHIQTLRPFLSNRDPAVRKQVVRALAVDPQSRGQIVKLAMSPDTPPAVRTSALRGLAREDKAFADYALKLVANRSEKPEVRLAAMRTMAGRVNYKRVSVKIQLRFARVVAALSAGPEVKTADGGSVSAEARKVLAHLKRRFAAVRKQNVGP